jgi:hypothetical protein
MGCEEEEVEQFVLVKTEEALARCNRVIDLMREDGIPPSLETAAALLMAAAFVVEEHGGGVEDFRRFAASVFGSTTRVPPEEPRDE